jgi:hypothetical protein
VAAFPYKTSHAVLRPHSFVLCSSGFPLSVGCYLALEAMPVIASRLAMMGGFGSTDLCPWLGIGIFSFAFICCGVAGGNSFG